MCDASHVSLRVTCHVNNVCASILPYYVPRLLAIRDMSHSHFKQIHRLESGESELSSLDDMDIIGEVCYTVCCSVCCSVWFG